MNVELPNPTDPEAPPPPQAEKRHFPCRQCGAKVEFNPGVGTLQCPYCGTTNEIPQSEEQIREIDFHAILKELASQEQTEDHTSVKCNVCAAEVDKPENVTSMNCPFCGSSIVMTAHSTRLIKPRSLLPFAIDRDRAAKAFDAWVKGLWFAPSKLKQFARLDGGLKGMYMPFWTYDSKTTSFYRGMRGDHYYVTETRTAVVNGKTTTRTVRVRKTRWWPASGTVWNTFDDVLVPASRSLPTKHVEALEPWDLKNLKPYADEYLSGFGAEGYTVKLDEGFEVARKIMDTAITASVRRDIGGDEQRIHSIKTQYDNVTFKHILLPVWISAYRLGDKVYRFMVNARTGEVQGERPWSWVKIAAAVIIAGLVAMGIFGVLAAKAGVMG